MTGSHALPRASPSTRNKGMCCCLAPRAGVMLARDSRVEMLARDRASPNTEHPLLSSPKLSFNTTAITVNFLFLQTSLMMFLHGVKKDLSLCRSVSSSYQDSQLVGHLEDVHQPFVRDWAILITISTRCGELWWIVKIWWIIRNILVATYIYNVIFLRKATFSSISTHVLSKSKYFFKSYILLEINTCVLVYTATYF